MCGRVACALSANAIQCACIHKNPFGQPVCPDWIDLNEGGEYRPSYNIKPKNSFNPVLLSGSFFSESAAEGERVISALRWGLVPSWYRADPQNFFANTANCRVEECHLKRSFRPAIARNQRCVVLAEGFFEWVRAGDGGRQPYFIYFKQPPGISMAKRFWDSVEDPEVLMKGGKWNGPRLLTMAGLFDVTSFEEDLYSYTILTMDAPENLLWLHNRVPVILDGDDAISDWLDPTVPFEDVTAFLQCPENLRFHPVSSVVGRMTTDSVECVLPLPGHDRTEGEAGPNQARPKKRTTIKRSPASPRKRRSARSRSRSRSSSARRKPRRSTSRTPKRSRSASTGTPRARRRKRSRSTTPSEARKRSASRTRRSGPSKRRGRTVSRPRTRKKNVKRSKSWSSSGSKEGS